MKVQRKFLSAASLGMLLVLFGAGFSQFAPHLQAQLDSPNEGDCILIGVDTVSANEEVANDRVESDEMNTNGENEESDANSVQDEADTEDGETEVVDNTEDGETDDEAQDASYTGSIVVDEAALDGMSATDQCTTLLDQATITAEEAQVIAEAEGTVITVSLEVENGFLVYGVQLEDGRDVKIDAGTGEIVNIDAADSDANDAENETTDEVDAVAPATTAITAEQAQAIAEAETGGTTLVVEYDVENGVEIFEVEMADGTDVKVSATDGTILLTEQRDAN